MDFAKLQLEKYGWKTGEGLGKDKHGMKDPVKVKYKFDTDGLGYDHGEQYKYHWWDHVFNKTAKSIKVVNHKDGVSIKKEGDPVHLSTKKSDIKSTSTKNDLASYGNFVKSTVLTDYRKIDDFSNSSSSEDETMENLRHYTDEKLFKLCEGRTIHHGARLGFNMTGKLARLKAQEEQYLADTKKKKNIQSIDDSQNDSLQQKKLKRRHENTRVSNKFSDNEGKGNNKLAKKNKAESRNRKEVNIPDDSLNSKPSEVVPEVNRLSSSTKLKRQKSLNLPDTLNDEEIKHKKRLKKRRKKKHKHKE